MADDPDDAEIAAQIAAEYHVLRECTDPRIPRVHGYYAGQAALAMSFIKGVSLTDVIVAARDGLIGLDVPTITDILIEIATALRHTHGIQTLGHPIVHGHLGSQRVMITEEGEIIVLGLGASPRGTHFGYLAPEQASGAFQDWRSDQWALGAIGIELLLGQRLYDGMEEPDKAAIIGDVRPWLEAASSVSPELIRPIRRTLATASGNRYQEKNGLIRDLLSARRSIEGLGRRRAVARSVMAMQERLSQQRPTVAPIQPRVDRAAASTHPAPVPPPTTPQPRRRPPVVLSPPKPPPEPAPEVWEDPAWLKPPSHPPRPVPVQPVEDPGLPRPIGINPTLTPEDEGLEYTAPHTDPTILEPTEALESVEELEATEFYEEGGFDDFDDHEPDTPVAVLLAALQPSEIAGMALGLLFAVLGIVYLFARLWS
ncbi:MAG: serine/threonine protein kinase [Myxococcota bacterium]|jgi:serine/threonine protein kinase